MEEMIKDTEGYMPSMDLEKLAAESRADGGNDNISVAMSITGGRGRGMQNMTFNDIDIIHEGQAVNYSKYELNIIKLANKSGKTGQDLQALHREADKTDLDSKNSYSEAIKRQEEMKVARQKILEAQDEARNQIFSFFDSKEANKPFVEEIIEEGDSRESSSLDMTNTSNGQKSHNEPRSEMHPGESINRSPLLDRNEKQKIDRKLSMRVDPFEIKGFQDKVRASGFRKHDRNRMTPDARFQTKTTGRRDESTKDSSRDLTNRLNTNRSKLNPRKLPK